MNAARNADALRAGPPSSPSDVDDAPIVRWFDALPYREQATLLLDYIERHKPTVAGTLVSRRPHMGAEIAVVEADLSSDFYGWLDATQRRGVAA